MDLKAQMHIHEFSNVRHEYSEVPVVLALHGAPGNIAQLRDVVDALSGHHRVLVPDLPGYGDTAPLLGVGAFEQVTEMLERELLARDIRELSVVGFSAGAYRALALALSSRVRVRRVVCLAGFAGLDESVRAQYRGFATAVRTGALDVRVALPARYVPDAYARANPNAVPEVLAWLDSTTMAAFAGELEAIASAPDLRSMIGRISAPIYARVGELDAAAPPMFSQQIVERAKEGTLEVVPGCGHALTIQDAGPTVAAVVRALV